MSSKDSYAAKKKSTNTCAQCAHRFIQALQGLIIENVWQTDAVEKKNPFQLSVGNVKIIIGGDSSVDRQHLFIRKQGWGGTVATSRCGSVRHSEIHMKLFQSFSHLSLVLLLFLALLIHYFFMHLYFTWFLCNSDFWSLHCSWIVACCCWNTCYLHT